MPDERDDDPRDDEDRLLRSVALGNAKSILQARQRAEEDLVQVKDELEQRGSELAQTISMLQATLEATTDAVLVTDHCGGVTGFNDNYLVMWGLTRTEVEGAEHARLLEHTRSLVEDRDEFGARTAAIYDGTPDESFDLLELEDGRVIERYSRLQRVAESRTGRVWSFRDITGQRRIEDALRDETRILELLNRTGMTLASTLDLDVLLCTAIDAATEISGAQFGALCCRGSGEGEQRLVFDSASCAGAVADRSMQDLAELPEFAAIMAGEGPLRRDGEGIDTAAVVSALPLRSLLAVPVAMRNAGVSGGIFLGHSRAAAFNSRTERLIAGIAAQSAVAIANSHLYAAAQRDAAERNRLFEAERAARANAERMSEMKDEFLATLSHELRTPLNAMLGWAQVLKSGTRTAGNLDKGLDAIERNARVQTQLIEDLLDMSRITSGKLRLDIRQHAPITFVEAALETVRPAADAKRIRIERLLDPVAGPIFGDPNRLQQVVWNLLSNAIKFTPAGGKIQVVLEKHPAHIELAVVDTGVGIAPEFLPYVFDRFRQADGSTTRRFEGLGLGLSIVKNLVELHGGHVEVRSRGSGMGAAFTLRLPLMNSPLEICEERNNWPLQVAADAPDLAGITVLVVDDEVDARDLVIAVLSKYGARVLSAHSADQALQMVQTAHPDVMLSDIGMPNIDGYALLARVRALGSDHGGDVPAVALTAFARPEDRSRTAHAGFVVHVAKPLEPGALARTVAEVVGRV